MKDVNTPRVTHLVTDSCRGKNFRYASTFGTPVMSGDWIRASWLHRHEIDFQATGPKFLATHKVKPFHGAHVHFVGFEPADFEVMTSELVRNGGNVCEDFHNENCTHVVVDDSKSPNIANDVCIYTSSFKRDFYTKFLIKYLFVHSLEINLPSNTISL